MIFGLIFTVFVNNLPLFLFVSYFVNIGYSLSYPIFKTIITDFVDRTKQGTVIGIDESLLAAASAAAPILASFLYENSGVRAYAYFSLILIIPHILLFLSSRKLLAYPDNQNSKN
jgi:MFS family permease